MSSESPSEAYVWVFLPGHTEPVVAGRLSKHGESFRFNYGRSYLERTNAIALYDRELPLRPGTLPLIAGLTMPGCLRDAAPDAWGRRVILHRVFMGSGKQVDATNLDELTFLLQSGSDRIGALDFQRSPTVYEPREGSPASLDELVNAAVHVEQGSPIHPDLALALYQGTAVGGARPKALVAADEARYIAKFSSSTDAYSVVKAEFVAMRLASLAGIDTAPVKLTRAADKDVLLVQRFDRQPSTDSWTRRAMLSALTLLELDEMMARYASYERLAEIIRHRFRDPKRDLLELYKRLVFNILVSNTDDHARNHAAFWDGVQLELAPAFDICPQARAGGEATQGMLIDGDDNLSRLTTCVRACRHFLLSKEEAQQVVTKLIEDICQRWEEVTAEAGLSAVDRRMLASRQFFNDYAFIEFNSESDALKHLIGTFKTEAIA